MLLKYVDGPTSSGKSYVLRRHACNLAKAGENVIIALPTIALIQEYQRRFFEDYPATTVTVFYSGDQRSSASSSVKVDVTQIVGSTFPNEGRTIIVTHATFASLKIDTMLSDWHVLLDEELDIFKSVELNLDHGHTAITNHIQPVSLGAVYARLDIVNSDTLRTVAENRTKDVTWRPLETVCKNLIAPWSTSYTVGKSYNDLVKHKGNRRKLYVFTTVSPDLARQFATVTVFCARFKETIHFQLWQTMGIEWQRDDSLSGELRFVGHVGFEKTSIYYGYNGNFSKSLQETEPDLWTAYLTKGREIIGDKEYILLFNNGQTNTLDLERDHRAHVIKAKSHGLNKYDHIHNALIASAYNHTPAAGKFLDEMWGIGSKERMNAVTNQLIYQAVSRTSMRNGDREQERTWIVPSKSTALWLSNVIQGSSVFSLGLEQPSAEPSGRPSLFGNGNDRKNQSRRNAKNRSRQTATFSPHIATEIMKDVVFHNEEHGDESTIKDISDFVALFRSSSFIDRYSTRGKAITCKHNDYVSFLRSKSKVTYLNKHDIPLVSPAFYNPSYTGERPRGKHNIVFASDLMLDVDGGDMTPEDFSNILPHIQCYAYNTFNNTKYEMRYRLYIPTTRPTYAREYSAIADSIVYAVEKAGFARKLSLSAKPRGSVDVRTHGIDLSKRGPHSLFHLPCKARTGGVSFFKSFTGPGRNFLNVSEWLANLPSGIEIENDKAAEPIIYKPRSDNVTTDQHVGIEQAMNDWYQEGTSPGKGYEGIKQLYTRICALKLPDDLLSYYLYQAASTANSRTDRERQVRDLLVSRRKYLSRLSVT